MSFVPPSTRQLEFARDLGVEVTPDMDRYAVSDALDAALLGEEGRAAKAAWDKLIDSRSGGCFALTVFVRRKEIVVDVLDFHEATVEEGQLCLTVEEPSAKKDRDIGPHLDYERGFTLPVRDVLYCEAMPAAWDGFLELEPYRKAIERGLAIAKLMTKEQGGGKQPLCVPVSQPRHSIGRAKSTVAGCFAALGITAVVAVGCVVGVVAIGNLLSEVVDGPNEGKRPPVPLAIEQKREPLQMRSPEVVAEPLTQPPGPVPTVSAPVVVDRPVEPKAKPTSKPSDQVPSDVERLASARLKTAKAFLKTSPTSGRKVLQDIVKKYPGTEAAKEAVTLLAELQDK